MFFGLNQEIIFQLILAVVLGGILGFERERAGRAAGVRTFALVCLGATLYVILSQQLMNDFMKTLSQNIAIPAAAFGLDPSRMIGQIVLSIGFLGAGIIIHRGFEIVGLTTAAGLWAVAAIGAAIGLGLYGLAVLTTLLALIILYIVIFFTKKEEKLHRG